MLSFTNPDHDQASLNRRESLLHHLQHPLAAPDSELRDDRNRYEFDQQRMDYLSGGIILGTDTVMQGRLQLTRAFQENRARNSGHSGVILSGDSTLGKTTTAKRLMRWVLQEYEKQVPDWRALQHVPVMYVEVPPNSSGKALLKEMSAFFGLSVLTRDSMADLRAKVVAAMRRGRTQLIVVDELHNLSAGKAVGLGETVDVLKGLHNDIAGTFLYCGIDVTSSSLMSGPRGQQLKSRFTVLELTRYNWSNPEHQKAWKALVRSFEKELQLRDHPAGTLKGEVQYLWQRTGGSIGSLGRLLTGAAIDVIQNGVEPEVLDRSRLDAYRLDRTAEEHYQRVKTRLSGRGKTAMEKVMSL
ncbi:hypothetical protein BOH66_01255 [Microbacterium aurum]|uniref:AAA family ATPase n=1 Tax=Microbacterium aurum TaxID=36805 RepID=A0A1P8U4M5_9MICO|nr:TniB family NTP-binding protein [Microbacterium aurum]APZ33078.1 hypothetical protein BOH66_01255 [Microbacterium aurum]MBM7826637.1 hypothetical protein [Microbacterium aurum]